MAKEMKSIMPSMNVAGAGGFFGSCMPLVLVIAESKRHTSYEFRKALVLFLESDGTNDGKDFYKIQSLQFLGDENDIVRVPIWIARKKGNSASFVSVAPAWLGYLEHAMNEINRASPGLFLYLTNDVSKAKVRIYGSSRRCFTNGNILESEVVDIHLEATWNEMKRTSCHELLHAIGILHEHQRNDRDNSIDVLNTGSQCCKYNYLLGVTRFDPFSIMLYFEGDHFLRRSCDSVWFTKPNAEINREMSQLDKVTLNNLYRPCKGPRYFPSKGITGLFYCGRVFGVKYQGHDGYCGPNNGPNCPACRVLKTDRVVSLWEKGKWQGWTGGVYCGRRFGVLFEGHDGYCGPNNGPPCPECYWELLKPY